MSNHDVRRCKRKPALVSIFSGLLSGLLLSVSMAGHTGEPDASPLRQHMQHLLTDGDQWRVPNPGFDPAKGGPAFFGLVFELAPDGSHVTGALTGIHEDGREARYWSLLAFYNPVTDKVVTEQVGWDGTLLYGEVPVQTGPVQIVDMIHFGADGKLAMSRHENRFDSSDTHQSLVFEPDGKGGWQQMQSWTWERQQLPGLSSDSQSDDLATNDTSTSAPASPGKLVPVLAEQVGFLLNGSGRWRAPNPDYRPGGEAEQFYAMNFAVGPHGQHVIGEIASIFADGRIEKDWSLYITYNPVTRKAWMEQTGASGVYFRGELTLLPGGRHEQSGIVYLPNGQAKSVRDEVEIIDDSNYRSHVFERDAEGGWRKAREWLWTLQDDLE